MVQGRKNAAPSEDRTHKSAVIDLARKLPNHYTTPNCLHAFFKNKILLIYGLVVHYKLFLYIVDKPCTSLPIIMFENFDLFILRDDILAQYFLFWTTFHLLVMEIVSAWVSAVSFTRSHRQQMIPCLRESKLRYFLLNTGL